MYGCKLSYCQPKTLLQHCKCGSTSYLSCLAKTSICLHSFKAAPPLKSPGTPELLSLYYYQPGHTMLSLRVYIVVFPAIMRALKMQQLCHFNL